MKIKELFEDENDLKKLKNQLSILKHKRQQDPWHRAIIDQRISEIKQKIEELEKHENKKT